MKKTNLTIGKGEGNLHCAEMSGESRRVSSGFGANEVIGDLSKAGVVGWWEQNPQCSGVRMWVGPGREDPRDVAEGGPGPRRLGFVLR